MEFDKLISEEEMHEAVVLAFANTLTPSTATRLRKTMTDVRKTGILGGGVLVVQAATVPSLGAKSTLQEFMVLEVPKQTEARGRGRGKGKKDSGGKVVPPAAK